MDFSDGCVVSPIPPGGSFDKFDKYSSENTGVYRFPKEQAAQIAITAIKQISPSLKAVKKVTFVCFSEEDKKIYDKLLNAR